MKAGVQILHVDDDSNIGDLVVTFLQRARPEFDVTTVTSAAEATQHLDESVPDCIISDYDMPGCNGIELLETVREQYPDLPFILFTGRGSEEVASEAISAGVTDYMEKRSGTDQYDVLANRVANAVDQYRSRRKAERNQRRLREVTESTNDCFWMFSRDWDEVLFVSGYQNVWNRPRERLEEDPTDFLNVVHPADRDRVEMAMKRLSDGNAIDIEYRVTRDDETIEWLQTEGVPVFSDDSHRIVGFTRSITENKRRRKTLEQFRTIVNAAPDPIGVVNTNGQFEYVNPAFTELTGHEESDLLGVHFSKVASTSHSGREGVSVDEILTRPEQKQVQTQKLSTADGGQLVCECRFSALGDSDDPRGMVIVYRNVTRQKKREAELQRARERMEFALEQNTAVVWEYDVRSDSITTYPDPCPILDGQVETVAGCVKHVAEPERERVMSEIQTAIETGSQQTIEYRAAEDVEPERIRTHLNPVEGAEEPVSRLVGLTQDITAQKERQKELERKSSLLDTLFEQIPAHLFVKDEEARHRRVSQHFFDQGFYDVEQLEIEEHTREAVIGRTDTEILDTEFTAKAYADDKRVIKTGEPILNKEEYVANEDAWNLTSKVPWRDDNSEIQGLIGITQRITKQKETEQQLERQNARLEEFSSIVSHDLQNPLTVASGQLELLQRECDSEHIDDIADALDRMDELISDLLALAKEGDRVDETEPVEIPRLAGQCWETVETKAAELTVDTTATIQADAGRLQQLLENLIRNAVEHGGDEVQITVGDIDSGFYVADSGSGIPEKARDDVFEDGYTTSDSGNGFGLSIVENIVQAHNWEISLTESASGGARFEITDINKKLR